MGSKPKTKLEEREANLMEHYLQLRAAGIVKHTPAHNSKKQRKP